MYSGLDIQVHDTKELGHNGEFKDTYERKITIIEK